MSLLYSSLVVASLILLVKHSLARTYEVPQKEYYDLELSETLFKHYIVEHQKQYTAEEAEYRHNVFHENLKRINELNHIHESTVFGVTPFSDLTSDEFMKLFSCVHNNRDIEPMEIPDIETPDHLDWREKKYVTEVKNQQVCGSCYIFGAIGEIEGQYAKLHGKLISLSEQYPLDCSSQFTCGGGDSAPVMNWLATTPGAIKQKDYPYTGEKRPCGADPKKGVIKVKGGQTTSVGSSEELKKVLASHGPIAIDLYAADDFRNYKGGVLRPADCEGQKNTTHSVTLIGYGNDQGGYWLIKNSWGQNWGEQGYLKLAMDTCLVGTSISISEVI